MDLRQHIREKCTYKVEPIFLEDATPLNENRTVDPPFWADMYKDMLHFYESKISNHDMYMCFHTPNKKVLEFRISQFWPWFSTIMENNCQRLYHLVFLNLETVETKRYLCNVYGLNEEKYMSDEEIEHLGQWDSRLEERLKKYAKNPQLEIYYKHLGKTNFEVVLSYVVDFLKRIDIEQYKDISYKVYYDKLSDGFIDLHENVY